MESVKNVALEPMCEKNWDERNDAEKLQALRDEVVYLATIVRDLQREKFKFENHEHGGNGKPMIPANMERDMPNYRYRNTALSRKDER